MSFLQVKFDETSEFPRANIDALASIDLLGLVVPKALGGLGQNHVCAAVVTETIARYGCASTAMAYGETNYYYISFKECRTFKPYNTSLVL